MTQEEFQQFFDKAILEIADMLRSAPADIQARFEELCGVS
jgi:hypothetical protein